ncbi:MAG: toll/interleukin-1 receptor domain-containing protein [Bacteroidia bacterium]|nr:toll/interleukin-1 receptor domain-containing protein [Bacteroidia bacterium]
MPIQDFTKGFNPPPPDPQVLIQAEKHDTKALKVANELARALRKQNFEVIIYQGTDLSNSAFIRAVHTQTVVVKLITSHTSSEFFKLNAREMKWAADVLAKYLQVNLEKAPVQDGKLDNSLDFGSVGLNGTVKAIIRLAGRVRIQNLNPQNLEQQGGNDLLKGIGDAIRNLFPIETELPDPGDKEERMIEMVPGDDEPEEEMMDQGKELAAAGSVEVEKEVEISLFAPRQVEAGDSFLIQVFAHFPEALDEARQLAAEFDEGAERLARKNIDLAKNDALTFELQVDDFEIEDSVQQIIWKERTDSVQYEIEVPREMLGKNLIGKLIISRKGIPIGHIRFKTEVGEDGSVIHPVPAQPLTMQRYKYAFISYSSKDRDKVLYRVQMLKGMKINFFMDFESIDPGVPWEPKITEELNKADVFYLFWSDNAAASRWVNEEINFVVRKKQDNSENPPEIMPVIIQKPAPAPPELLRHLQFNDKMLYFMGEV